MSKKCEMCFHEFIPNPKFMREQRFCSRKCSSMFCARNRKGQSPFFTILKILTCKCCQKEFKQRDVIYHNYCSDACLSKHRGIKKNCPTRECECGVCSKKFLVKNNLTAKYCSDKCRSKAYYRKTYGHPIKAPNMRAEHGEGYINKLGYRIIYRDHPNSNKKTKCILEHIFIMSEILGRPMRPGETVHHKNGVRSDNRPENLEVWTSRHPSGIRLNDAIQSAIALLTEEGYKVVKE